MVAAHLRACGFSYSLSVFQPESGVGASNGLQFSEAEMLQQLNVHPSSSLGQRFSELWGAGEAPTGVDAAADGRSFALVLLQALAEVHAAAPRHEAETQTRNGPAGSSLNDMSLEMERLEAKFAGRLERQRTEARLDFDRQMAEHRAEADRVSRAELDARVEKVREIEVGAARVSEAARYQERLAHEKAEMEKLHRFQLSKLREKEIQMTDRLMQQQRKIDAMEFDHRGQVERESAEMQTRRAEHEAWVAEARAAAAAREAALEEREQKHLHDHRLRTLDLEKQLSRAAKEVAEARDYRERVRAEVLAEAARGLPPQYAATLAAAASGTAVDVSEAPLSVMQALEKRVAGAEEAQRVAEATATACGEELEALRRELQARPAASEIARAQAAWEQERRIWTQREEAWQGALAQANQVAREATEAQEDAVERLEEARLRAITAEREAADSRRAVEHLRRALEVEGALAEAGLHDRCAPEPPASLLHAGAAPSTRATNAAERPTPLPPVSPQRTAPTYYSGPTTDVDLGPADLAEEESALRQRAANLRERTSQQQAAVRAASGHFHDRLAALHQGAPELSPAPRAASPASRSPAAAQESSAEDVAADIVASFAEAEAAAAVKEEEESAAAAAETEAEAVAPVVAGAAAVRAEGADKDDATARARLSESAPEPAARAAESPGERRSPGAKRSPGRHNAKEEPTTGMGWGSFAAEFQKSASPARQSPSHPRASGDTSLEPALRLTEKHSSGALPGVQSPAESLFAAPSPARTASSPGKATAPSSTKVMGGAIGAVATVGKRHTGSPARAPLPAALAPLATSPPAPLRPLAAALNHPAPAPALVPVEGESPRERSPQSSEAEVLEDDDLGDDSFGGSDLLDMLPDGQGSPAPPLAPDLASPVGGRPVGQGLPPRSPTPAVDPSAVAAEALAGLPPTPPGRARVASPSRTAGGARGGASSAAAASPLLGAAPVLLQRERSGASFADSEPAESVEEELSAALLGAGDSPSGILGPRGAVLMQALPSEPSRASPERSVVEIDFGDVSLPDAGYSPAASADLGGGTSVGAFGEESEISVASHRFSGTRGDGDGDSGSDERLSGGSSGSVF